MDKKISIVIPCYNVALYVQQCIHSVVKQTYSNIEIIVVNDGSTDNTLAILKEFEKNDQRIILVNQQNQGLSAARNTGIALATGKYITFVDSDDWLALNYLEELVKPLNQFDLSICSYNKVFKNSIVKRLLNLSGAFSTQQIQRRMVGLLGSELKDPSAADSLVTVWGKLYKTSQLKHKISFVSTKLIGTEDLLFNLKYLDNVKEVFVIDKPLYFYRKYNDISLTNTYKKDLFEKWLVLFMNVEAHIQHKPSEFYDAFYNRICLSIIGLGLNEVKNPDGFIAQMKNIKKYLNHPLYKNAFTQLKFKHFPWHWKLFFKSAQVQSSFIVLVLLKCVSTIIAKNNKDGKN